MVQKCFGSIHSSFGYLNLQYCVYSQAKVALKPTMRQLEMKVKSFIETKNHRGRFEFRGNGTFGLSAYRTENFRTY